MKGRMGGDWLLGRQHSPLCWPIPNQSGENLQQKPNNSMLLEMILKANSKWKIINAKKLKFGRISLESVILKPRQLFLPFLFPAQQVTISTLNWGSQEPRAPSPTMPNQRAFCLRRTALQHSSCCSQLPVNWSQVSDKWDQYVGASLLCTILMCYVCYHNKNKGH